MIIALTGMKRSGKDTCAAYFEENYGFINYKFAGAIKRAVADIFLCEDDWINGKYKETTDPKWGISMRKAQQAIGTDLFRDRLPELYPEFNSLIGKAIWVKRFQYWFELQRSDTNVVISDLRFLNEAETVRKMGGIIIRVNREDSASNDHHPSETEMSKIIPDHTVENNSSILDLYTSLEVIYGGILSAK